METYIKYKRIVKDLNGDEEIQKHLDSLSSEGWDIIFYNEAIKSTAAMTITTVVGKKQSNIL